MAHSLNSYFFYPLFPNSADCAQSIFTFSNLIYTKYWLFPGIMSSILFQLSYEKLQNRGMSRYPAKISLLSLLGIDRHALFGAYGMRRALLAAVLIATTHAAVFTEGGALGDVVYPGEYDYPKSNAFLDASDPDEGIQEWYPKQDLHNTKARDVRNSEELDEELAEILQQLAQQKEQLKPEDTAVPSEVEIELQNPKEQPNKETGKVTGTEKAEPQPDVVEKQPLVAQKKGQNEFVSFVEPIESKQTQSIATMEKRRLAGSSEFTGSLPTYSSNLLMIGSGILQLEARKEDLHRPLRRRRSSPDDSDYAPYAGTGPGFKMNKGDKGDESLAYKAQLHQYQQAKQKIICGEDAPAGLESDGEDDGADDENNFSVYECPGLAPTGDIEVCNPNFAAHP
ncbi:hypothetical protein GCK32_007234 [Trichostrongylus colubriformis]|uniref:Neural proliferation differentiation and control protein 1 n=1 Tax=Trichostrongylus colubriformis TaxID=6319 RepID=A0AAN8FTC5_TRICO